MSAEDLCPVCEKDHNEDMVACDRCGKWFHYDCVGVDSSVKDYDWYCSICKKFLDDYIEKEIEARLEAALQKRIQNAIGSANKNSVQPSASYDTGAEQHGVTNTANQFASSTSQNMHVQPSTSHGTAAAQHGVTETVNQPNSINPAMDMTDQMKNLQDGMFQIMQRLQEHSDQGRLMSQEIYSLKRQFGSTNVGQNEQPVNQNGHLSGREPITVSNIVSSLGDNQPAARTGEQKTKSIFDKSLEEMLNSPPPVIVKLSEEHRIARKTLGDDLPQFSGNVMEWPLFLTNFVQSTQMCGYTDWENRRRLDKSILPPARNDVRALLMIPENVPMIIKTLQRKYGKPYMVVDAMLAHVERLQSVPAYNYDKLIDYSIQVNNLCTMVKVCGDKSNFDNRNLLRHIVSKLPPNLCEKWTIFIDSQAQSVDLLAFNSWLDNEADLASKIMRESVVRPSHPNLSMLGKSTSKPDQRQSSKSNIQRSSVNAHSESVVTSTPDVVKKVYPCKMCQSEDHQIEKCDSFLKLNTNERWEFMYKKRLCRICLKFHPPNRCFRKQLCGTNGCVQRHHPLMHREEKEHSSAPDTSQTNPEKQDCNTHQSKRSEILFKILPVTLYGPKSTLQTFAFLDDGSSVTLLESDTAEFLGLDGPTRSLCLSWTGNVTRNEFESKKVSLQLAGVEGVKYTIDNARTVKKLDLPKQTCEMQKFKSLPHLKNIKFGSFYDATPKLLIGIDQPKLNLPLTVREGKNNEPSAIQTRLGWTLFGPVSSSDEAAVLHHRVEVCQCQERDDSLHELVKGYFSIESTGVDTKAPESRDDERARSIMEATTKRLTDNQNKFETGLLWRHDIIDMPDSYPMALRRLICLETKLKKDGALAENLSKQMEDYVSNGYARKLSREEATITTSRTWFLPIFAVKNVNKPNKTRLVWDAAASVKGVSLNSVLLKGPDLLTSLMEVLYRFRQKPIAISADIKQMFHQVNIRKQDQDSQRFLWRGGDVDREPDHYVMSVMTFGASCSPSLAQYIKNRNAEEHRLLYPKAAEAIVSSHYVDDYLDSVDSINEAIQLARDVKLVHSNAGFHIRGWLSNSSVVQEALEGKIVDSTKDFKSDDNLDKILGMWWDTKTDEFRFKLNYARIDPAIISGERRPTKRELLRTLMSVYDPLGLVAFLLINIKVLLQDVWRAGIEWDEELNDDLYDRWKNWSQMLVEITNIAIPRCYQIGSGSRFDIQLHLFSDASEAAYATVAYLRISAPNGVSVSLVGGRTKVAPLHPISVPRLELQAAVLSARFGKTITSGHTINIQDVTYWTDSEVVLRWLRSDQRKYRQYVALRVGEIIETTDVRKWRWVPTKANVADDATKWTPNSSVQSDARWFTGPSFLYDDPSTWPVDKTKNISEPEEERKVQSLVHVKNHDYASVIPDASRISHYRVLVRSQAYVHRYIQILRQRVARKAPKLSILLPVKKVIKSIDPLTSEEITRAENFILRQVQMQEYHDDMLALENDPKYQVPRSSSIFKLSPYVDENGVLRHRGRIDVICGVAQDTKRPIILPRTHAVTLKLVHSYHRRFHHGNHETVINEIKQRFMIPKIRVTLRSVRSACQFCKIFRAKPVPPEMGNLPLARLSPFTRPFTYTGMDFFGPMEVWNRRCLEKRWGVIFTCLTTRAVHIELADSLDTDTCILCIRSFIARRGKPNELYSDNGTNLRGADVELRKAVENLDQKQLMNDVDTINWKFIPPASPHMGGAWERLVQSVKKILKITLPARRPSPKLLRAMLTEAELIINSRPLTHVTVDADDPISLTPNHFLLGDSTGSKPIGEFTDADLILRKNWRKSQRFADIFWQKWIREYLPTIIRREKWHEKVPPIKVGDLVFICDEKERNSWVRGVVMEAVKGSGDQVRSVHVKTNKGTYIRPATKVAVLDVVKECKSSGSGFTGGSVASRDDNGLDNTASDAKQCC